MKQEDFVKIEQFGKDHWSTFMYATLKAIDYDGYEVGYDAHMRSNRRNYRVLKEENPTPGYAKGALTNDGVVMTDNQGSRLKGNVVLKGHDDWDCLQDAAQAGLFMQSPDEIQPKVKLKLSVLGLEVTRQLLNHKQNGGNYAGFIPDMKLAQQQIESLNQKNTKKIKP